MNHQNPHFGKYVKRHTQPEPIWVKFVRLRMEQNCSNKARPWKFAAARRMRKQPTPTEKLLWDGIRGGNIKFRFRRQVVILGWIVDFYCPLKRLVIEVDGLSHNNRKRFKLDKVRDAVMEKKGFHVVRFTDREVEEETGQVVTSIWNKLRSLPDAYLV